MRYIIKTFIFPLFLVGIFQFLYAQSPQPFRGISGMTLIDSESIESEFLYIYDFKVRPGEEKLKRFGVLSTTDGKEFSEWNPVPVDSEDWSQIGDVKGNDFEAICKVPKSNQFLVVESSYYKGNYGRLILVEFLREDGKTKVIAKNAMQLPKDVEQIEGMVCVKMGQEPGDKLLIVISERDGKTNEKTIRWEYIDPRDNSISELKFSESLHFQTPDAHGMTRDITDLYLDPSGRLWCSASRDMGDFGPFRSAIYLIGQINSEKCCKIHLYDTPIKKIELEGFKIEALSSPVVPGTVFTIGTDDEKLGSVIRPIYN